MRLPVEDGKWPEKLVAEDGSEAPLQAIERGGHSALDGRERVTFGFVVRDVPGFGYRTYRTVYLDETWVDARANLKTEQWGSGIENQYFDVAAAPDGTLIVEDRNSSAVFPGLNRFIDSGERGDEYTYCPPEFDAVIGRPASPPEIRLIEGGPARQTLEVRMHFALPAGLTGDRKGRSEERVDCDIVTRVSLYPGVARVDIETEVDNRAMDHRLRVHFPTGIRTDRSHAEQHFGVVSRPIEVPEHDDTWFEKPVATYPQKAFVDISDGERGFMLANRGLPEFEAIKEAGGTVTIALTLLRCVEWLSRDDLGPRRNHAGPGMHTPGAQMQGRWKFQYSLIPHAGGWENGYRRAHEFLRPLRAVRTSRGDGSLPPSGCLVEIERPEMILSAFKLAEDDDGVVARVYNIADRPVDGHVRFTHAKHRIDQVNLNEERPVKLNTGAERSA